MEELSGLNMKGEGNYEKSVFSDNDSDTGSHCPFFILRAFYLSLLLFRLFMTECIILEWRRYFYRTASVNHRILKGENYSCGRFALKSAGWRDVEQ
jgi:hypothetical protein